MVRNRFGTISFSCTYIFCWGKKTFPPLPRSISAFVQAINWLIFLVRYFVSFFTWGTLTYTRLLKCPIQMPSLLYLIFTKKQRIRFFDPLGGWVGQKNVHLNWVVFLHVAGPPFPGLCVAEPVIAALTFCGFSFELLGAFFGVGSVSIFPHKWKIYSICSNKTINLLVRMSQVFKKSF